MTDLTADKPRAFLGPRGPSLGWPMAANLQLFMGAALMMNASTGLAANVTPTASAQFIGFAEAGVDNRTGSVYGGAAAAVDIPVTQSGRVLLSVAKGSAIALTDVGTTVYASDGDTFTTSAGTNNIPIGKILSVPAAAVGSNTADVWVAYEATAERSL